MKPFQFPMDVCLFVIGALYILAAPYAKVEESFNMQATHDMLFYGYFNIEQYDHHEFPGVVPRTFIGSLLLSFIVQPFKLTIQYLFPYLFSTINIKIICQYLIRLALLFINITSLSYFRQSFISIHIPTRNIKLIKTFTFIFTISIITQFHFLFYGSRLLPNCFALPLVTFAFAFYIQNKYHLTLQCLAASTIFFRCDTIVIAVPFIIVMFFKQYQRHKKISKSFFIQLIIYGVIASIICISLTLVIDSWFWNRYKSLKWPELEVLLYNTLQNKSSNWGVSPWNQYFTKHLIKMLLVNIIFIPFSIIKMNPIIFVNALFNKCYGSKGKRMTVWKLCLQFLDCESIQIFIICFVFIFLYSFLPHKETRFIFFVIPPLTLLSTIGCIRIVTLWGFINVNLSEWTWKYYIKTLQTKHSSNFHMSLHKFNWNICMIIPMIVFIAYLLSFVVVFCGVLEASYNYPGGVAITNFEFIVQQNKDISCYNYNNILNENMNINNINCVHIGNKAAMSGVIRFTTPAYCNEFKFDKKENLSIDDYAMQVDPCNLLTEICQPNDTNEQCNTMKQNELKKNGYDYLITEIESVPGYTLLPNGIIYAKSEGLSIFEYIIRTILSRSTNQQFLEPTLYMLKRE